MTIKEKYRLKKFAERNPIYGDNFLTDALLNAMGGKQFNIKKETSPLGVETNLVHILSNPNDNRPIDPDNLFIGKDGIQAFKYLYKGSPWIQQINKDNIAHEKRLAKFNELLTKDKALSWFTSPKEKFKVQRLIKEKAPIVEASAEQINRMKDLLNSNDPVAGRKNIDNFAAYVDHVNNSKVKDLMFNVGYGAAGVAAGGGLVYLLHKLLSKKKKNKKVVK